MKFNSIYVLSVILFASLCTSCEKQNISNEYTDELQFTLDESKMGYYVSNGTNINEYVNIPNSYNNLPVVGIADKGFYDLSFLKEVKMPDSIKEIGESAFESCENLKKVYFSNSLEKIDTLAFRYCEKLKKIQLPDSVKEIHLQAFAFCDSLSDLSLPSNLEYVSKDIVLYEYANKNLYKEYKGNAYLGSKENPYMLLAHCVDKNLEDVTVHNNCKYISSNANLGIKTITLSDSIEYIDMCIGSENLKHVYGNPKIKYIGNGVFSNSINLMTFPTLKYLNHIGISAFSNCRLPYKDLFLENIDYIGQYAFSGAKYLRSVTFGRKIRKLENYTFSSTHLTHVYIPSNVTSVSESAFKHITVYGTNNVINIYYEGNELDFVDIGGKKYANDSNSFNVYYNYNLNN